MTKFEAVRRGEITRAMREARAAEETRTDTLMELSAWYEADPHLP